MDVEERIRRCLILEDIRKYPQIASRIRLVDTSKMLREPKASSKMTEGNVEGRVTN